MLLSTSPSKTSTSDLFVSDTSELLPKCDPLAQVTGLRQYNSPAISSGFIVELAPEGTRENNNPV